MVVNFNSDWLTEFIKQLFILIGRLSSPTLKTVGMLLVLMTFWFLSIYIIGRHFYDSNPTWIVVLFCFVVSVAWLVANIVVMTFAIMAFSSILERLKVDTYSPATADDLIIFGGLNSIVYLTVILFISIYNNFEFRQFIIWCGCYPLLALTVVGLGFLLVTQLEKPR
jgi:hypothetical protein